MSNAENTFVASHLTLGQMNALVKKVGGAENVLKILRDDVEVVLKPFLPIDLDAAPYVPDGWKVKEHRKGGQFKWDPTKVKLHLSKNQQGGRTIEGHKLRKELAKEQVFNANLLDYLLKPENQHLIPEEWKQGNTQPIFFWGTIYRASDGGLCVRCLCREFGEWCWNAGWLSGLSDGDDPAAVLAR